MTSAAEERARAAAHALPSFSPGCASPDWLGPEHTINCDIAVEHYLSGDTAGYVRGLEAADALIKTKWPLWDEAAKAIHALLDEARR